MAAYISINSTAFFELFSIQSCFSIVNKFPRFKDKIRGSLLICAIFFAFYTQAFQNLNDFFVYRNESQIEIQKFVDRNKYYRNIFNQPKRKESQSRHKIGCKLSNHSRSRCTNKLWLKNTRKSIPTISRG